MELDDPAPAGVEDLSGQAAIVWMITKMPPVVSVQSEHRAREREASAETKKFLWSSDKIPLSS